jgi:hypothetical protein
MEFKKPLRPHPLLSPVGGRGKGVLGKVVSSFFIDDIFYVIIVFKIHEIICISEEETVYYRRHPIAMGSLVSWCYQQKNLFYLRFIINYMLWGIYLTKMPHALDVSCYIQ